MTPTGRTPSKPNIQNIPIRTTEGDKIRKVFIDAPNFFEQQANAATIMEALADVTIKELEAQGFKVTRVQDAIIAEEKENGHKP